MQPINKTHQWNRIAEFTVRFDALTITLPF